MNELSSVCVVDDQVDECLPLVRGLERRGLEVHFFPTAEAALAFQRLGTVGCVVADMHLPGINGLRLLQELRVREINAPFVFISGCASVGDAIRAFNGGARAFFEKPFEIDQLLTAVEHILLAEKERASRDAEERERLGSLSQREFEVLTHLVNGKSVKSIGRELGISPSTAEKHRASVLSKTGLESVVDLTRFMLSQTARPAMANSTIWRVDAASSPRARAHVVENLVNAS